MGFRNATTPTYHIKLYAQHVFLAFDQPQQFFQLFQSYVLFAWQWVIERTVSVAIVVGQADGTAMSTTNGTSSNGH